MISLLAQKATNAKARSVNEKDHAVRSVNVKPRITELVQWTERITQLVSFTVTKFWRAREGNSCIDLAYKTILANQVIYILANWHVFNGFLTWIACYPCQKTQEMWQFTRISGTWFAQVGFGIKFLSARKRFLTALWGMNFRFYSN